MSDLLNFIWLFSCYDQCIPYQFKHFACWKPNHAHVTSIYVYCVPSNLCLTFWYFHSNVLFLFFFQKLLNVSRHMVPLFWSATMTRFWFASSTSKKVQKKDAQHVDGQIDMRETWRLGINIQRLVKVTIMMDFVTTTFCFCGSSDDDKHRT